MAKSVDVAAYILNSLGNATTMKLQKLVYYSQARNLVRFGAPIFEERIEAWVNGPVAPELYRCHAGKYMLRAGALDSCGTPGSLSDDQRASVDFVVEALGSMSGEALRELTHGEDPWMEARAGIAFDKPCDEEITLDSMRRFYSSPSCTNPISR